MSPSNPFFAIIVFCIAFLTGYLIQLKYKVVNDNSRYGNIDGLRGFLALGVFIHHSAVWYQYFRINDWDDLNSNFYNQLGQTSVSFFFMITAFLFITKLLNTKSESEFDWKRFFISRSFRIVPMYIVSIAILIFIVLVISNWEIRVGIPQFLKELFYWGTFTIIRNPIINDVEYTYLINAGVIWSLHFEWLFYFSLPLISLLILKRKPSIFYILISLVFVICFFKINGNINKQHLLSFVGGTISPFIIKYGSKKVNYNSLAFSIILLTCLGSILFFNSSDNIFCKVLITIIFTLITLGNNLFGLLKNSTLKFLGEICYSTYLMHGIILFTVLYFGLGADAVKLSPLQFCLLIFAITPVVVAISFCGYKFIERPFMNISKKLTKDSNTITVHS